MSNIIKKRIINLFIFELVILLVFAFAVQVMQSNMYMDRQKEDIERSLNEMPGLIAQTMEDRQVNETSYDRIYVSKAKQAAYIIEYVDSVDTNEDGMKKLAELLDVTEVHLVGSDGTVIASSTPPVLPLTPAHRIPSDSALIEENDGIVYRSYCVKIYDMYVVIRQDASELVEIEQLTSSTDDSLSGITLGLNGLVIAMDRTGTVIYSSNTAFIAVGQSIYASGISEEDVSDGNIAWGRINGKYYYMGFKYIEEEEIWIGLGIPNSRIQKQVIASVGVIFFCALCILTIFNLYVVFLYEEAFISVDEELDAAAKEGEKPDPGKLLENNTAQVRKKLNVIIVIGTLIAFVLSVYVQTLSMISIRTQANREDLEEIRIQLESSEKNVEYLKQMYTEHFSNKALVAAFVLGESPSLWTREDLAKLSAAMDSEYVIIFDGEGNEIISDSFFEGISISDDPTQQTYSLRKLMYGYPYVVTDPAVGEYSGELHQDMGASIRSSDGEYIGFLVTSVEPDRLSEAIAVAQLNATLESVQTSQGGYVFSVSKADNTFSYYPNANYIGKDATQYGLKENEIRDAFNGFIKLFDSSLYASTMETENDIIIYTVNASSVVTNGAALFALQVCFMIFVCLLLCAFFSKRTIEKGLALMREKMESIGDGYDSASDMYVDVVMPDGSVKKTLSIINRLALKRPDWDDRTPEQKLKTLFNVLMMFFAVLASVCLILKDYIFSEDSLILYILGRDWEKGANIFSLTHCAMTICIVFVVHQLFVKVLSMLPQITGPKAETVLRLVRNLAKYVAVVTVLYLCLSYLGIDSATLVASAGLLTLVIGLGAQSLISDILSGLFIIFEGEFQVGDIVTIDGFRGTVQEIGIRTTKILSGGGDLKIIRNTNVNNIINMTRKNSRCICDLLIEYGVDLQKTIDIFESELPGIKERVPQLIEQPKFAGVAELGESGILLRFIGPCAEKDRFGATYGLNRELKLICERHNINIPFPQVVIHDGEDNEK